MDLIINGTDKVGIEYIKRTIIDCNVKLTSLIISKENYGAIYADETSC